MRNCALVTILATAVLGACGGGGDVRYEALTGSVGIVQVYDPAAP